MAVLLPTAEVVGLVASTKGDFHALNHTFDVPRHEDGCGVVATDTQSLKLVRGEAERRADRYREDHPKAIYPGGERRSKAMAENMMAVPWLNAVGQ